MMMLIIIDDNEDDDDRQKKLKQKLTFSQFNLLCPTVTLPCISVVTTLKCAWCTNQITFFLVIFITGILLFPCSI